MMLFAQADPGVSKALQGPDYVMLIGYFVLMLGIGVYFYRFMRGMKVYLHRRQQDPLVAVGRVVLHVELQRLRLRDLLRPVLPIRLGGRDAVLGHDAGDDRSACSSSPPAGAGPASTAPSSSSNPATAPWCGSCSSGPGCPWESSTTA